MPDSAAQRQEKALAMLREHAASLDPDSFVSEVIRVLEGEDEAPTAAPVLSLTLCEEQAYAARRVVLFRRTSWPSIPPEGALLAFGIYYEGDDKGEESGVTARVRRVFYDARGGVQVEAELENLRDEYDHIVALAKNDGFMEWAEWKDSRGNA